MRASMKACTTRTSTDVGIAMGKQIGDLAVQKFLRASH